MQCLSRIFLNKFQISTAKQEINLYTRYTELNGRLGGLAIVISVLCDARIVDERHEALKQQRTCLIKHANFMARRKSRGCTAACPFANRTRSFANHSILLSFRATCMSSSYAFIERGENARSIPSSIHSSLSLSLFLIARFRDIGE